MTRSLEQQVPEPDPEQSAGDTQHVLPPIESFTLSIELDAADQLEASDPVAVATGLHPQLAELELLLYPSSATMILNQVRSLVGSAAIVPLEVPLVLFVYGPARVVPVRLATMSITELAFDPLLNPIQARVEMGLRSLTQRELTEAGPAFEKLGLVRQIAKEMLVTAPSGEAAAQRIRGLLPL
jgi:hypothetical protein